MKSRISQLLGIGYILSLILLVTTFLTAYVKMLADILGVTLDLQLTQLIQIASSTITIGGIGFAYWQYLKNQKEKLDIHFFDEGKATIDKMTKLIENIPPDKEITLPQLKSALTITRNHLYIIYPCLENIQNPTIQSALAYRIKSYMSHELLTRATKVEAGAIFKTLYDPQKHKNMTSYDFYLREVKQKNLTNAILGRNREISTNELVEGLKAVLEFDYQAYNVPNKRNDTLKRIHPKLMALMTLKN